MTRLYDLPIGYWRAGQRIFAEEAVRQPDWASTLGGLRDSQSKLARKDEELQAASAVIVASSYVRSTLQEHGFTDRPVFMIPYGSYTPTSEAKPISGQGPLRVLFVGSLGQRKGLSYLLDAIAMLGSAVSLTLIGQRTSDSCTPLDEALLIHRWIPSLPHPEILAEMRAHDVLVFPSLFEGFGLVLTEALSQGIPVIATPHTAAPDLISDGVEGFLVPIRDSGAIAERLQQLSDDRDLLAQMSAAALTLAEKRNWDVYQQQLVATVRSLL
jgi:glycosyltransferase involved in cell wall biosynthesis